MNNIERVYSILKSRLPKNYIIPIKLFKNTKTMLYYHAKKSGRNYIQLLQYYNWYLKNPKKATYMKTKYWTETKRPTKALEISALGGNNPILISTEKVNIRSDNEIAFILLHEFKHCLQRILNEKEADMFAIRWVRKLKKEGILK